LKTLQFIEADAMIKLADAAILIHGKENISIVY
jgi:hypothetical protein